MIPNPSGRLVGQASLNDDNTARGRCEMSATSLRIPPQATRECFGLLIFEMIQ